MGRLYFLIAVLALSAVGVLYLVVDRYTNFELGRGKRAKKELEYTKKALENIQSIVDPYIHLGEPECRLLADMVLSEIRKADSQIRKELA